MKFTLTKQSKISKARLGVLTTAHGKIATPFFMPIATRGAVKTLDYLELAALQPRIILSNTYHLYLKPGHELIKKAGGLHTFMQWSGSILTDSGGYQVFSLSDRRKITEAGALFSVDEDGGQQHLLSPEKAVEIQLALGVDLLMVLDECPPYPCKKKYAAESLALTTRWAKRSKDYFEKKLEIRNWKLKPGLFGIVQGSTFKDLRIKSARQLVELNFDGYAVGGVAVGEPREKMTEILKWVEPELPKDKPRYLMGLGKPEEIVAAVRAGMDMFDCVIPTREGRHGKLFIWRRDDLRGKFYVTAQLDTARFKSDFSPINPDSALPVLRHYSKAYLYHLFRTNEMLGMKLATLNNVEFYLELMRRIRQGIGKGRL
ncbi:tRNA guanosine(34) transglycosylase Tgt [Candidatus Falkowbacteria bacterium]|nr:tRNA guanosine(34) transglycosylase Tgt [Candidatus Falkowbacteria bacterium]